MRKMCSVPFIDFTYSITEVSYLSYYLQQYTFSIRNYIKHEEKCFNVQKHVKEY
jgi:hypothetical protein